VLILELSNFLIEVWFSIAMTTLARTKRWFTRKRSLTGRKFKRQNNKSNPRRSLASKKLEARGMMGREKPRRRKRLKITMKLVGTG